MPITCEVHEEKGSLEISVSERFDFGCHAAFRAAYESAESSISQFIVNLSQATYIDSSALGMLLLLRDYAQKHEASILIQDCQEDVKRILLASKFDNLFSIS